MILEPLGIDLDQYLGLIVDANVKEGADMKRTIRFLKVAILTLFGTCTILLVGGIHFSATNIIESPDFLEPAYQGDEYFEELNPKSDYLWPHDDLLSDYLWPHDDLLIERNIPEVIQL